jgi:hypothetical protein
MGIFSRKKSSKDYAKETTTISFGATNFFSPTEINPSSDKNNIRNDIMTHHPNSMKLDHVSAINQATRESGAMEALLILVLTCGCVYTLLAFAIWVSIVGFFVVGVIALSQINQEEWNNFRLNMVMIKKKPRL